MAMITGTVIANWVNWISPSYFLSAPNLNRQCDKESIYERNLVYIVEVWFVTEYQPFDGYK